MQGNDGDDTIVGGAGNDTARGGEGNDLIRTGDEGSPDRTYPGRYTADIAKTNALPLRDFFVTQAAALGITPMALYQQFQQKTVAEGQGALSQQITVTGYRGSDGNDRNDGDHRDDDR